MDSFFDVLANQRRRFVIACLDTHSRPMAMADVADELTRWECDASKDHIPNEEVEHRYNELHHVHVPKLVNAGIVEYDAERKTLALVDELDGISTGIHPSLKQTGFIK